MVLDKGAHSCHMRYLSRFINYCTELALILYLTSSCLFKNTKQHNVGHNSSCLYILIYVMGRRPSKMNKLLSLSLSLSLLRLDTDIHLQIRNVAFSCVYNDEI